MPAEKTRVSRKLPRAFDGGQVFAMAASDAIFSAGVWPVACMGGGGGGGFGGAGLGAWEGVFLVGGWVAAGLRALPRV